MAYFANGTAGLNLDEQCSRCIYGEKACPIYWVQLNWNYEACNNKVAREILDYLIADCGRCTMFEFDKDHLKLKD
jgi:hypothetical protein